MSASWCELFRHFTADDVDPFEIRRRATRCSVRDLAVLDLTVAEVRGALGVTEDDLTRDDYAVCQRLADAARAAGLDAVVAPSAALAGHRTLALFPGALDDGRVVVETERVQVPPINLVKLLPRIRAVPAVTAAFEAYASNLARRSYEGVRRRYRRR
jgi:hypothetical protein